MNVEGSKKALAATLALALLLPPSVARAADPGTLDTVYLKGGGRLRGTVMEEDPKLGVTIQLSDGTTRKVSKSALDHVEYAPTAATASPSPAPVQTTVVPLAPQPAPPPQGYYAPMYAPQPTPPKRSKALLIMGIIFMPVGAIALCGGGAYYASNSGSSDFNDGGGPAAGIGLMTFGTLILAAGIVFTIVGAHHRAPPGEDAWVTATTPKLGLGPAAGGAYLAADGRGFSVHF